jgi:hypothetical protein
VSFIERLKRHPTKLGYQYDNVSEPFRWQIYYLMENTLGKWKYQHIGPDSWSYPSANKRWDAFERALLEHHGIPYLDDAHPNSAMERINEYLLTCNSSEFLMAVTAFLWLTKQIAAGSDRRIGVDYLDVSFDSINNEVHAIFKRYNFGYEIIETPQGFTPVRIDSQYLHQEIVMAPISLLHSADFQGANREFTKALDYYSLHDYENAIHWANRAFESTIKSVLDRLNLSYDKSETAKKLISRLFDYKLIFPSLECLLANIQEVFGGLPTIRNKMGGHGYGSLPIEVQKSYAELAIHLSGTFIVFLVKRYEEERVKIVKR